MQKIRDNTANMKIVHNKWHPRYRIDKKIMYRIEHLFNRSFLSVINLCSDANKQNIIMSIHVVPNLSELKLLGKKIE